MPENKVVFGLKNSHYSVITEDEGGALLMVTRSIKRSG